MMKQVLKDMKSAGYAEVVLWVFKENSRAIAFYEAFGFSATTHQKEGLGAVELCYSRSL